MNQCQKCKQLGYIKNLETNIFLVCDECEGSGQDIVQNERERIINAIKQIDCKRPHPGYNGDCCDGCVEAIIKENLIDDILEIVDPNIE